MYKGSPLSENTAIPGSVIKENRSHVQVAETECDQTLLVKENNWTQRTFGPMEKGSVRASIMALMSCAMGSGLLAFPSNAKNSGIILGVIFITVCAGISRLSMFLLLASSFKTNVSTFTGLVEHTLGRKVKWVFEVNIILYIFGSVVCLQILFSNFLWDCCRTLGVSEEQEPLLMALFSFGFIIFNLPISLLRDVFQLRYFAQLQLAVVVYIVIAIIVYFFANFNHEAIKGNVEYFILDINFFGSFASTFFGFIAHQLVLPLKSELKNSNYKRMSKVCTRGIACIYVVYSSLTVVGYLTWFTKTNDLIIDNYDNMYFNIAKGLMAFALFFGVPLNINPMRLALLECIGRKDSKPAYVISTVIIQITSGVIAYVYPNVKYQQFSHQRSGFGLLGGFLGLNMVVVVPCWMYIKNFGWNKKSALITVICSVTTVLGWLGAVLSQIYK